MVLSPADFYAYSAATGVPIPDDAQGRAELAPRVIEFRRNELKAQQPSQEGNALATLGTAAAGIGALAGLGFGARALLGRRGQQIPKAPKQAANAGVRQANLAELEQNVRRVAAEPAPSAQPPIPSITRMRSVMPTEEESFTQYRRQLEEAIPEPTAEELNFPEATSRLYGQGYRERQGEPGYRSAALAALEKKYPPSPEVQAARRMAAQQDLLSAAARLQQDTESLTDLQKIQNPVNADQFINAVESGEDQTTGRLVRNLNIGDPWGEATVPPAAINEQITAATPLLTAAAVSPREKAQEFLQSTFEELGPMIPGRYRRERAMGQDPMIAEAMELYASTGDPSVLSRLSKAPSSPLTVKPQEQTELLESEVPTRMFFKPTGRGEFVDDLFEKDINLTNRISQLGVEKQNIQNRIDEIDALEPQLRFAAASEPGQGGYYTRMLNKMLFEKQSLNPESVNVDLGDAIAQRDYVRMQTESLEDLGSTYNLVKRQEGVRPFYEVDPETNEPIAETFEIRSGRPSVAEGVVTKPAEGSSIRGISSMEAFGGDLLSSEGIYGTERAYSGASASSPEASIPPSASPSAWRLPAGSRSQNKKNINIVVAGGREYQNYPELSEKLDRIISDLNIPSNMGINIVSGGARGADTLAERYAQEKGYGLQVFPADWKNKGLAAGMERNRQMAKAGDVLVAFPGGSGTENMIQQMTRDFGKPAYRANELITTTPESVERVKQSLIASERLRRQALESPGIPGKIIQGPMPAAEKTYQYPQSFLTEKPASSSSTRPANISIAQPMQGPKNPPVQGPRPERTNRMSYENSPLTPEEQFIAAIELEAEKQKMAPEDVILKTMATTPSKIRRAEERLAGPAYLSAYAKQRGYF